MLNYWNISEAGAPQTPRDLKNWASNCQDMALVTKFITADHICTIPKLLFLGQSVLKKLGQNRPHCGIGPQILFQFVCIGYRTLLQMKVVCITNRTLKKNPNRTH